MGHRKHFWELCEYCGELYFGADWLAQHQEKIHGVGVDCHGWLFAERDALSRKCDQLQSELSAAQAEVLSLRFELSVKVIP